MEIQKSKRLRKALIDDNSNGDIPDWLLFQVLLRLPPYFVCSYKIVSKQWLSMASDSYFIRSYISRAKSLPHPWTVLSTPFRRVNLKANYLDYIVPRDLYLEPHLCKLCLPCEKHPFLVIGVSDGLVLYCSTQHLGEYLDLFDFCISNPITGQWIKCCEVECSVSGQFGFLTRVDEGGVLKSYRIVQIQADDYTNYTTHFLMFSVYYSEIGEWKKFKVPYRHCNFFHPSLALDGILHWPVSKLGVIAYDPDKKPEHVRTIKLPGDASSHPLSLCALYRGKLRYFENASESVDIFEYFKIWELDDYDSGKWRLQHKITNVDNPSNVDLGGGSCILLPLFFDLSDKDVVFYSLSLCSPLGETKLVSYNFKTKTFANRNEMIVHKGLFRSAPLKAFLFEVPPWPTIVADHHLEQRSKMLKFLSHHSP